MINSVNASYAETNGHEQAFSIAANANLYEILTSKIYTNPIEAVVRELVSNAIDSGGQNVMVSVPNSVRTEFVVEDNGCGMTAEEINNIYATYGASNKTNSNEKIGGLGLGAKSPLAYTSQFELITGKNGLKNKYFIHMNSEGIPCKIDAGEEKSDWNGTKVTVSIKPDDVQRFQKAILKVCLFTQKEVFFDIKENYAADFFSEIGLNNKNQYNELRNEIKTHSMIKSISDILTDEKLDSRYMLSDFFKSEIGTVCVNMGGVCYTVDTNKIFADYEKYRDIRTLILDNFSIILNSPIGSLSFQASREELNYTDDTISKIRKLIVEVLGKEIAQSFDDKKNTLQQLADNVRSKKHLLNVVADLGDEGALKLKESINIKFNAIKANIDKVVVQSNTKGRNVFIGDWHCLNVNKYVTRYTYVFDYDTLDHFLYMLTNAVRIITYTSNEDFSTSNIFTSSNMKIISNSNLKNSTVTTKFILIPEEDLAVFKKYFNNVQEEKYEDLKAAYKALLKTNRATKAKAAKEADPTFVCSDSVHTLSELVAMKEPKILCMTTYKLGGHCYNIPKVVQSMQIVNPKLWWSKSNSIVSTYGIDHLQNSIKSFISNGLLSDPPICVYATLGEFRDAKVQTLDNFYVIDTYLKEFVNVKKLKTIEPIEKTSFDISERGIGFIYDCIKEDSNSYNEKICNSPIVAMVDAYRNGMKNTTRGLKIEALIQYIQSDIRPLVSKEEKYEIAGDLAKLQSKTSKIEIAKKYPMLRAAVDSWKYSSISKGDEISTMVIDYINLVDHAEASK